MTPVLVVPLMLFAGFFINQDNIPSYLAPIHYVAIYKYAYQALMINEFTDLDIPCMNSNDPNLRCDPLGDYQSPQTISESLICLAAIWFICFLIAYLIMKSLSGKYE